MHKHARLIHDVLAAYVEAFELKHISYLSWDWDAGQKRPDRIRQTTRIVFAADTGGPIFVEMPAYVQPRYALRALIELEMSHRVTTNATNEMVSSTILEKMGTRQILLELTN